MPIDPFKIFDGVQVGLSSGALTYLTVVKLTPLERASLRYMTFYMLSVERQ